MDVASQQGWRAHPGLVLDFYNERRREIAAAKPNAVPIFSDSSDEKFTAFLAWALHDVGVETAAFAGMHHRIHPQRHPHICSHAHGP